MDLARVREVAAIRISIYASELTWSESLLDRYDYAHKARLRLYS